MGHYAILNIGAYTVATFRSSIPLTAILMFDRSDWQTKERLIEEETYTTVYQFCSTVQKARQRLDERGLDFDWCRSVFEELKTSHIYRHFERQEESMPILNEATFEEYVEKVNVVYQEAARTGNNWLDDKRIVELFGDDMLGQLIFGEYPSIWDDYTEYYFYEAADMIHLRAFLEVAPKDAPVTLDVSELVDAGYIPEEALERYYSRHIQLILQRIELDYKIYGFVLESDPNVDIKLKAKIEQLNEDEFIDLILVPLLKAQGFIDVKPVTYHGQWEFGKDILPFRKETEFGTVRYLALQAKSVKIHGVSAETGNAAELINQANTAFTIRFIDSADNEVKQIDELVIATNKEITPPARRVIEESIIGNRRVHFLDISRVVDLIKKYRLAQYVLFSIPEWQGGLTHR